MLPTIPLFAWPNFAFAEQVDGYQGIVWDVYYCYGPDATWETIPSPLRGAGSTIYSERQALKMRVRTLLEQ